MRSREKMDGPKTPTDGWLRVKIVDADAGSSGRLPPVPSRKSLARSTSSTGGASSACARRLRDLLRISGEGDAIAPH